MALLVLVLLLAAAVSAILGLANFGRVNWAALAALLISLALLLPSLAHM